MFLKITTYVLKNGKYIQHKEKVYNKLKKDEENNFIKDWKNIKSKTKNPKYKIEYCKIKRTEKNIHYFKVKALEEKKVIGIYKYRKD